jgi:GAF domain-containing protein
MRQWVEELIPMSIPSAPTEQTSPASNEGFRRIARAMADRLPAVDTLPMIAEEAATTLGASTVVIALVEEGEYLRFRSVSGSRAVELQGVRVRVSESVADRAIRSGEPFLHTGPADELRSPSTEPHPHSPSVAVAPILFEGSTIGALLAMGREEAQAFSEDDADQLMLFADQTAAALALDESERIRAEQARELSVLYRASRSVGASLNLQEILDSVLESVCEHLDTQSAVVFLANDERSHLFVAAERGLPEPDREIQLNAESQPIAQLLASGRARILTRNDDLPEFGVFLQDDRSRAALVAPIQSRSDCHGVLVVTSSQPDSFTDNDVKLVEAVAAYAGIAISNAWLYEDATQRAEHSGALYDLSQHLNATLRAETVNEIAVDSVLSLLNVDTGAIMLADPRTGRLSCKHARGPHGEALVSYAVKPGQGVAGWVYEWETPQSVAHVAADPRNGAAPMDELGISSALIVPISTGERVLGVLIGATGHRRLFTVGEMELLYTVANQSAVSLFNADQFTQATKKSSALRRYFRRVARALGESVHGVEATGLFAELAVALTRAAVCNIYALEGENLVLRATSSDRASIVPDETTSSTDGLTGYVARKGQHLTVEELSGDARLAAHPWTSRQRLVSYIGVPLRAEKQVRGVVEVYLDEPNANMREEARLLAHFARLAKISERLA